MARCDRKFPDERGASRGGVGRMARRARTAAWISALLAALLATGACQPPAPSVTGPNLLADDTEVLEPPLDAKRTTELGVAAPGPLEEFALPAAQRRAVAARCSELLDWVVRGDQGAFDQFVSDNQAALAALRGTPASAEQLATATTIAAMQRRGFDDARRLLARALEIAKAAPSTPIALRWEVERCSAVDDALFFDLYAPLQFDHGTLGWRVMNFCARGDRLVLCGFFAFEPPNDR